MHLQETNENDVSIAMLQDDIDRHLSQRREIELVVSDLLSDRGEDELTAKACEKVLHLIRNTSK